MIDYVLIHSSCLNLDSRLGTLIRCSKDSTERARLFEAQALLAELELAVKAAHECYNNPLVEVSV